MLRTYTASLELPRNIYFRIDFTYEMKAILYTSLNYIEEKAKQNELELQAPFNKNGNCRVI